ncbi:hypothetical protein HYALB_00008790 [Hymenoscyphus albidus]|uniref:[histone H3]-trimethyl-L-lysine(9) demethylase n=1 Tax=Hymenoscyphus albidus TaxID=595503 RepID=A0A9N9Q141_9HELO|nr:hypothetical protein HYALB_00008790 [Hymenoscyphus albidus]
MSAETMVAGPAPGPAVEVNGLHSPPDSNTKDASDSELSDLEEEQPEQPAQPTDEDDIGEIVPAYYSNDGVPVFEPTMHQFKDFTIYMNKVNPYGMRSGIVKVIPPAEWKAAQPRLDEAVRTIKVKEPIKQDIMGTGGTYRQANMIHQRSYNLPQWRQLCEQSDHQPPAKRGERRANQDKPVTRSTPRTKPSSNGNGSAPAGKRGRGRPSKSAAARAVTVETDDAGQSTPDRLPTPVSPSAKPDDNTEAVKLEPDDDIETPEKPRLGSRQAKPTTVSVSSRRKNNRREREGKIDEAAFKDFKYELEGNEFTPERCEELERAYWKTLTYAPPLYGADMPGTLFDDKTTSWNLGKLDNILDVMGSKIPGVNTAYLYLGMWKATFAWHLEDVDLYSINYVHFGAPKQWYAIAQGDARRFEAAMKTIWPTDAKACDQFLRHKTFLISPSALLQNYNIKVNKIVAYPGEFVITFPYGYHSGYNLGYNCAEAVNFGLESWLEYGRVAKKCDCDQAQDSVWINVHELERKLRGEETEYEETDEEEEDEEEENENDNSTLATPPLSTGGLKTKSEKKKRKRATNEKGGDSNIKRVKIRIKATTHEPCVLCPNDIPSEALLPTEDGQHAHQICAQYIPETSIDEGKAMDIKYIAKGRLELKCNYCRSKKGACFQCSRKKCTRAYHATCAAAAGVLVEQGEIPVFGEDGTEYKEWGIEFSCRFHRVKREKKLDSDTLSDCERLRKAGTEIKVGEVCQAQYLKGDIFAGVVVENCKDEEVILLDILPRGDRVEVEYKWLLIPDPADYHLPKPSPNALPMPKSRKDKASLNTSKRQADDIPRAEDPFVEGHTWAEFNHEKINLNPYQVKIDFTKETQIWFYLGKTSTEARAQYTEDPRIPRHNTKGNFLDTIPKPVIAAPRQSYAASYPSNAKNSTPTPIRPPAKVLPAKTDRLEKPYVYKPREQPRHETYGVDAQAYRAQKDFLQRSVPQYSFGTDPRWASSTQPSKQSSSPTPFKANANSTGHLPQISQVSVAPPQYRNTQSSMTPNLYSSTAQYATAASYNSAQATSAVQHRPDSQHGAAVQYSPTPKQSPVVQQQASKVHSTAPTQYRSTPPMATSKPNNPFGNRPQPQRPSNVFQKYYYLQKEHNRSPSDYKSPYRPGGGFMNGYQGDLMEYTKATLFTGNRPGVSTSQSNATPSYNMSSSYNGTSHKPSPSLNSSQSPSLDSYGASPATPYSASPSVKPPMDNSGASVIPPKTWEKKKDSSQLHPAIRREFLHTILNKQTNPLPQPSPTQSRSSVLQPPPLYERPPYPSTSYASQTYTAPHNGYAAPSTPQNQVVPQPTYNKPVSLSASHPQQYSRPVAEASQNHQSPQVSYAPSFDYSGKAQGVTSTAAVPVAEHPRQQSSAGYHNPSTSYQTSSQPQASFSMHQSATAKPQATQSPSAYTTAPASNPPYGHAQHTTGISTNHPQPSYSQANYAATSSNYERNTTSQMQASPVIPPLLSNFRQSLPNTNSSLFQPAMKNTQAGSFHPPAPSHTTPILPPPRQYQIQRQSEVQKSTYQHQQSFQRPDTQMTSSEQHLNAQPACEPADVPPDSCSIVEKMLRDLKKARADSS